MGSVLGTSNQMRMITHATEFTSLPVIVRVNWKRERLGRDGHTVDWRMLNRDNTGIAACDNFRTEHAGKGKFATLLRSCLLDPDKHGGEFQLETGKSLLFTTKEWMDGEISDKHESSST